ncbi:hypothetical protein K7432_005270 [Basidiobolus ranarum]|uniref:Protein PBN1 n=1 Tax=Basidiobolus ranarum TaxID=34480 RepID=A0ABR2WWU7_9FUNG
MLTQGTFDIEPKQSFHPNLLIHFPTSDLSTPHALCKLNVFYDLPRDIILDPYQLNDLEPYLGKAKIYGKVELEVPVSEISEKEAPSLLISPVISTQDGQELVEIKVPVHMRYQLPANIGEGTHESIMIKAPYVFWSCPEGVKLSEAYNVDELAPSLLQKEYLEPTNIYPITLSNQNITQEILMPKGQLESEELVQNITLGCMILSFLWVVFTIVRKAIRNFRISKED